MYDTLENALDWMLRVPARVYDPESRGLGRLAQIVALLVFWLPPMFVLSIVATAHMLYVWLVYPRDVFEDKYVE